MIRQTRLHKHYIRHLNAIANTNSRKYVCSYHQAAVDNIDSPRRKDAKSLRPIYIEHAGGHGNDKKYNLSLNLLSASTKNVREYYICI